MMVPQFGFINLGNISGFTSAIDTISYNPTSCTISHIPKCLSDLLLEGQ